MYTSDEGPPALSPRKQEALRIVFGKSARKRLLFDSEDEEVDVDGV